MRRLLLLFVLLASAHSASAQSVCNFTAADLVLLEAAVTLEPGKSALVPFTIHNPNQNIEATASIATRSTGSGWTVTATNATRTIGGDETVEESMTISTGADAADTTQATVIVTLDCTPPQLPPPIGTAAPPSDPQQATVQGVLAVPPPPAPPPGGGPAEGRGGIGAREGALILLVVAIPLLIAGGVLVTRRKAGLVVVAPEREKGVGAGKGVSFPLEVTNKAAREDVAFVDLATVPAGWRAFTAMPEVHLGPGETRRLTVMIRAPAHAETGRKAEVVVRVKSKSRANVVRDIVLSAKVQPETGAGGAAEVSQVPR